MELAPAGPARYVFDIGGNCLPDERFDLVTSRSVLEHVRHVDVAVSNSTRLLRPGGLAVHFMPTLYSVPFVVNRILPEPVADFVLQVVAPRDRDAAPKFPAFYDHCKSTDRNIEKLHKVSGAEVAVVPYYDHTYFNRIPVVRALAARVHREFYERDFRPMSSFCFLLIFRPAQPHASTPAT
jgi:SAM-dependent methyltransferase